METTTCRFPECKQYVWGDDPDFCYWHLIDVWRFRLWLDPDDSGVYPVAPGTLDLAVAPFDRCRVSWGDERVDAGA